MVEDIAEELMEALQHRVSEVRSDSEETSGVVVKAEDVDEEGEAAEAEPRVRRRRGSETTNKIQRLPNHHRSLEDWASLVVA